MSTSIAFLSGKGGSGKTTLALSIADLICHCDASVLLIDCDMSTNGATYFFETKLTDWIHEEPFPTSFYNILTAERYTKLFFPFTVRSGFDFIPSVYEFSGKSVKDNIEWQELKNDFKSRLESFLTWANKHYDVILFDCQAGYTELLSTLLPLIDVDLFVMEADSISASAMRSLHLKIGGFLNHARLYQVFNKATPEEFDIYSKIVGTFFTNIGTLLFDWKIRQAFSRSQIPELKNTSIEYGNDLCNICRIMLSDEYIQEKLNDFSDKLKIQKLEKERDELSEKMYNVNVGNRGIFRNFLILISISVPPLIVALMRRSFSETNLWFVVFVASVASIASIASLLLSIVNDTYETRKERQKIARKLKELNKEYNRLHIESKKEENAQSTAKD